MKFVERVIRVTVLSLRLFFRPELRHSAYDYKIFAPHPPLGRAKKSSGQKCGGKIPDTAAYTRGSYLKLPSASGVAEDVSALPEHRLFHTRRHQHDQVQRSRTHWG